MAAQLCRQNHIIVVVVEWVLVFGFGVKTIVCEGFTAVDVISYHSVVYLDGIDVELCEVNLLFVVVLGLGSVASLDVVGVYGLIDVIIKI